MSSVVRRLPCALPVLAAILAASSAWGAHFPLTWRWSNPLPHGNNIIDIAQTNQFWIQVAERGQIYTSGDLVVWTPRESHTTRALRSVTFFKDRMIISGEAGTILSGTNALDLTPIDLGTGDWLEGIAASPEMAVAVGDNGAIFASLDGTVWQRQTSGFNDGLRSVAYGTPNGAGMFVAVGEGGIVAKSSNGVSWDRQTITPSDLNRVAWFSGEFWALGDSGAAFQSSSANNWQRASTGATNTLNAFAGLGSSRLVAGDLEVRLRHGRDPWVNELASGSGPPAWTYLSAVPDTNSFVLCGRTGLMQEGWLGASGATEWVPLDDSLRNWLWDIQRFPNVYIAVGDRATIMSSVDGISWDVEVPPDSLTDSVFLGIGGRTNLAIAVGNRGAIARSVEAFETVVSTNLDGTLVTNNVSTLGLEWQAANSATTNDLQGITAFGNLLVASGAAGTILTSADGLSWTPQSPRTKAFLSSLEAFPGGVVAVGREGTILVSPDASDWTPQTSGVTSWIYRVRYVGGMLIAVGQNGTILTSPDGQAWAAQKSGTTAWLNDVHWIDNTYFAVGNQGTVLSSPDAIVWTDRGTITGKSLFGAASHQRMLVIVGVEGVILRTQAVPLLTPVRFLQFPEKADDSVFLFSGEPGQRFTLDRSESLPVWNSGPTLEIDNAGTLLHKDSGINASNQQFFRTSTRP